MGMGPGSGMMDRHHADVPAEYAGFTNPASADEESVSRGAALYVTHCATCHGDYGNGDGPGGASLDPAPAPIAHTSQMMSDAYLFWRISEGGNEFETGMIPYKDILDENARWDVINYLRALGRGAVSPGQNMGGQPFDPAQETAQRVEMLAEAVSQSLISQTEADLFERVHQEIDQFTLEASVTGIDTGNRADALPQILDNIVAAETISRAEADQFLAIHDQLISAGLMQ